MRSSATTGVGVLRRAWRRTLVTLLVGAVVVAGSIAVARLLVYPAVAALLGLGETTSTILRRLGVLLATVAGYWAHVRWYERRPAVELAPAFGSIALGAVGGALSIGVTLLVLYATGHYRLVGFNGIAGSLGVAGMMVVIVVVEEIFFRGIFFRLAEERLGTPIALLAVSLAFGLVHLANSGGRPITALSVALLGAMWTAVYVLVRNLWVVVAHHAAWNATIFTTGLPLSGNSDWRASAPIESIYEGADLITGAEFGPEDSIVSILLSLAYTLGLLWLARRRGRVRGRDGRPDPSSPRP